MLRDLKKSDVFTTSKDGTTTTKTLYTATLTNGSIMQFEKQQDGARVVFRQPNAPSLCGLTIEKINDATIIDSNNKDDSYNLYGCKNTTIVNNDKGTTSKGITNTVKLWNHEDGTKSENNKVVSKSYMSLSIVAKNDAMAIGYSSSTISENQNRLELEDANGGKKTYSNTHGALKESYVNAKNEVVNGYTRKTSPDGKEKWYYDPKGNPISERQFNEAQKKAENKSKIEGNFWGIFQANK
jgi:hypothetical protein